MHSRPKVAAIFALASAVPSFAAESFSELVARADELASKGVGLHYDNVVGKFAAETFGLTMKHCLDVTPHPDRTHFDVLVVLGETGTAEQFLVQPETNLSQCVSTAIQSASFPHPPQAHYPVHLSWGFKS